MEKVVYPNGTVLYWDSTLTVGELITAYASGYHILTGFEFRDGATPIVHYVTVIRADGTKVKKPGATRACDAAFVRRVTKEDIQKIYDAEVNAAIAKRDNLLEFATRQG